MAFTQETFLGASIRSFDGNIGWQGSPSTVTVRLVEDDKNGDSFITPVTAQPYKFQYQDWEFVGIVQKWEQVGSSAGNPLYEVILEDARNVLDGTQLILNNYASTTFNIPNLLNVYGYLEDVNGFGGANVTDAGMPWQNVRDALIALSAGANLTYGSAITQSGFEYELDLSELPVLPSYYRVSAQNKSVMEFIKEVCDAANHDFYFVNQIIPVTTGFGLTEQTTDVNFIKVVTIDRNQAPTFGAITDFVQTTEGAQQKRSGVEFRTETTSKFLVGGNEVSFHFQGLTGGDDDDGDAFDTDDLLTNPSQNGIWQYWGLDLSGNAIIGDGMGVFPYQAADGEIVINYTDAEQTFSLPSVWVEVWPFDEYPSSSSEMRAAEEGEDTWETYLWLNNYNWWIEEGLFLDTEDIYWDVYRDVTQIITESEMDTILSGTAVEPDGSVGLITAEHKARMKNQLPRYKPKKDRNGRLVLYRYHPDRKTNPHFGKATLLKIGGQVPSDFAIFISGKNNAGLQALTAKAVKAMTKPTIVKNTQGNNKCKTDATQSSIMYAYVKEYADEYYGKKYMVRIPFVSAATDSDTGQVKTSREPEQSGFLDESIWDDAISVNWLPSDVNKMSEPNGRIKAYMRMEQATNLDFSEIGESDIVMNDARDTAFILVQLQENLVYVDRSTLFSPRVVVEMPGTVRSNVSCRGRSYAGVIAKFLDLKLRARNFSTAARNNAVNKITAGIGSDALKFAEAGEAIIPETAAVPLRSNITTYGPWYAAGANGKLDFEQDDSLVPWNYGGFAAMNNAANAKVTSAISQYQESETGSVTFPGVPAKQLGAQLALNGPYITDIHVNIGEGGATTTYNMSTWSPQPYKMRKVFADAQTRLAINQQRLRREYRERIKDNKKTRAFAQAKKKWVPNSTIKKPHSSMTVIAGSTQFNGSGVPDTVVAVQTHDLLSSQLGLNYTDKAACSLDVLFHPYASASGTAPSGWPSFKTPAGGATTPTIDDLNPFGLKTSYGMVTYGQEVPEDGLVSDESRTLDDVRSMAFRLPAVFTGPAYTTSGTPFPDDGLGNFPSGVNDDPSLWACGPLDLRWNNERGVFEVGTSSSSSTVDTKLFRIVSGPFATGRLVYSADEYTVDFTESDGESVTLTIGDTDFKVGNFRQNSLVSGAYYVGYSIGNKWIVDNQASFLEFI